jgi:uncharacterized membrane protein
MKTMHFTVYKFYRLQECLIFLAMLVLVALLTVIVPLSNLSEILVRVRLIVMTVVFWQVLGLGRYQEESGETAAVASGECEWRVPGIR